MEKTNPYNPLKKLIDSGNVENFEEIIDMIGNTNLHKIMGLNYKKMQRVRNEPDILSIRNIRKLAKEININPYKITDLIFKTLEKEDKTIK